MSEILGAVRVLGGLAGWLAAFVGMACAAFWFATWLYSVLGIT